MQVEGTRMLRVRAVAQMFDVSKQTVYRAIHAGALPAVKLGINKGFRVPETAVKSWIKSRVVAGTNAAATGNATGGAAGGSR